MSILELFHARLRGEGAGHLDIIEHLPLLHYLATCCWSVTEFGVRTGNSTIAFLAAGPRVTSYDINPPSFDLGGISAPWDFRQADTSKLEDIEPTDLLFLDSLHTYAQVKAELAHAHRARRFLVFHDTVLNGAQGERGEPGILPAIAEFCATHPEWEQFCHMPNCNGLLVLVRKGVRS
jgi:hypothetical protein